MSKDNHQQSVGGQGAIDGLSGSEHSGTEGADSGQGVNKGGEPVRMGMSASNRTARAAHMAATCTVSARRRAA